MNVQLIVTSGKWDGECAGHKESALKRKSLLIPVLEWEVLQADAVSRRATR